ncbi:type II toxin-antitoxin system VapC family toxin [Azospirillum oleiclasticum]|uniref:type II toxin-antitoxin system VapC family toxin n=1 Tax=Azospirillum oleiclasticum TaxID=2735135 RepID=UPI003CCCC35E
MLDTNVLLHLLKGHATGLAIERALRLSSRPERPLLSSIVEGELRGLAAGWKWGPSRLALLEERLAELVPVSAGAPEVVRAYGELYAHQSALGRRTGENDLWIAATASAVGGIVLTCDGDFMRFDGDRVRWIHVDVATAALTASWCRPPPPPVPRSRHGRPAPLSAGPGSPGRRRG